MLYRFNSGPPLCRRPEIALWILRTEGCQLLGKYRYLPYWCGANSCHPTGVSFQSVLRFLAAHKLQSICEYSENRVLGPNKQALLRPFLRFPWIFKCRFPKITIVNSGYSLKSLTLNFVWIECPRFVILHYKFCNMKNSIRDFRYYIQRIFEG